MASGEDSDSSFSAKEKKKKEKKRVMLSSYKADNIWISWVSIVGVDEMLNT